MARTILSFISFSLFFLGVQAGGAATQIPRQLYGKSVTVYRNSQIVFEDENTGKLITSYNQFTDDFYFSVTGRIFVRRLYRNQFGSSSFEQIGSDPKKVQRATRTTGNARSLLGTGVSTFQDLRFEGRILVAIFTVGENTARRLAIEFDQNFGICTPGLLVGTDNGKPERLIGWDGHVHRVISGKPTSKPSCVVRDGNIFE
jgi:hypothetical protein